MSTSRILDTLADMRVKPNDWVALDHDGVAYLAALMPYPDVSDGVPCQEIGSVLFFPPDNGGNSSAMAASLHEAACKRCPVFDSCLEWAIAHEGYGVWAGTTATERDRIRYRRKQALVDPMYAFRLGLDAPNLFVAPERRYPVDEVEEEGLPESCPLDD